MTIFDKLAIIQQELIAPKNQFNSFGKYNYRSCEDILEGLKPCLKKVGAFVTINDEVVLVGERYYIKATATLHDVGNTGGQISNTAYAREEDSKKGMDASQVTGATSSYARKYALNGLFAIDDVKDADTRDNRQKDAEEQQNAEKEQKKLENMLIPEIKVKALLARCESEGVDPKKICKLYKVNSIADLTEKKFRNLNDHWSEVKDA